MKFNMERRQKYLEEILRRQQRQIMKITKELELHREFLNLQFESFMDFLVQNGGQVIQLSGKNGQDETGMFFPMKREKNGGGASGNANGEGGEDNDNSNEDGAMKGEDQQMNGDDKDNHQTLEDDDELDPLPPPQAILGSPSGDGDEPLDASYQKQNGSHGADRGQSSSSRRSSANVVSSSDAQNGDGEYDEVDSSAEYENNANPEMMKYDMNHFMFSHFLDGAGGGEDDQDGMDDSYNEDDMAGYEGEDDMANMVENSRHMGAGRQSSWSNNGNARSSTGTSLSNMPKMSGNSGGGNNLPIPPANFPHNERTCRYCGKTFHWKQSWVIHERTHTGEKPYVCKCGKAFSQKSNMNTHAKSCSQATATQKGKTTVFQMKCSHCQKMFTHKKNLDLHMEKFHPEVLNLSTKPLSTSSSPSSSNYQNGSTSTSLLDAEFAAAARAAAENAAILQILKTATAASAQQVTNNSNSNKARGSMSPDITNNSNSNSSFSGSDDRNNRFPCPYCPKRFPVKGTLERHLRVHTGEKPFLCGLCGKAFTQKGSVKLHLERVHRQTM